MMDDRKEFPYPDHPMCRCTLEFGALKPRPFLRPAFLSVRKIVMDEILMEQRRKLALMYLTGRTDLLTIHAYSEVEAIEQLLLLAEGKGRS